MNDCEFMSRRHMLYTTIFVQKILIFRAPSIGKFILYVYFKIVGPCQMLRQSTSLGL